MGDRRKEEISPQAQGRLIVPSQAIVFRATHGSLVGLHLFFGAVGVPRPLKGVLSIPRVSHGGILISLADLGARTMFWRLESIDDV
jgi:hypothetical protein